MFTFWLVVVLLLLIPLCVILVTLMSTHENNDETAEGETDLYQLRLAEIEQDIENGLLSGTDAKNIKKELQLTLLNQDDNHQQNAKSRIDSNSSTITAIILLILTPVFAISMYIHLGQPELMEKASLLSEFHNASTDEEKIASIDKMLSQLEQRMINDPDDIDGWLMLTNSYTALERYPEALRAVDNLYRLRGDDPSVLLRYADILAMTNGGVYAGKPTDLINEAIRIDPENPNGLWFAGLAANERGDVEETIKYWQRLIPKLEEGSEQQQHIKDFVELVSQQNNSDQDDYSTNIPKQESNLHVNVSLSDALMNDVKDDDTVFIYAKALSGPPMPLAIVSKLVSDLPLQVVLNDSMAMMSSNKLSDHKQVQLVARISKSGNAIPESGDLIGLLDTVQTNINELIELKIDKKVP